jgi:pimeloyl-ACP methyl ester carboxylesterase
MNSRIAAVLTASAAALLGGDPVPRSPHVVRLKDGSEVRGRVNSEAGAAETVVNLYNSRNPAMTFGVERIPAAKVAKVEAAKNPWAEYVLAARETPLTDADGRLALAKRLKEAGFKALALEEIARAAAADVKHPSLAKALPDAELQKLLRGDFRLNPALAQALDAFFAEPAHAARRRLHEGLVKDFGYAKSFLHLERVRRSKAQKTGRQEDRPLTLRSKSQKGVYTLYVPAKYDARVPVPLILGLHGGGTGGKDGKEVVGSGASAMNFYQELAERRGYIVACPTAVAAPWQSSANEPFLLAVLEEVLLLYNIDENRVYLTGHSMGGFGTWSFGPKHNELFAVIAPMSGGGANGFQKLRDMGTAVYLYHGADDTVCRVGDSHRAGETMRREGLDFIYTELPSSGHSLPREILDECFDFFDTHRLYATPDRGVKGTFEITKDTLSSFDRKVSADEREYLDDPLKPRAGVDTAASLVADLKKGGGAGAAACAKLIELADPAAVKPLIAVVQDVKEANDARGYAARALGKLGAADAVPALVKAIAAAEGDLLRAFADALGDLGDKRGAPALREGLKRASEHAKSKTVKGNTLDYSDYENVCEISASLVSALGRTGDPASALDIARFPAEGFLLAGLTVDATPLAGQNPDVPRRKLAKATVEALEKLANPACAEVLAKVRELAK